MTAWRAQLASGAGRRTILVEGDADASRGALVSALRAVGHLAGDVFVDGSRWSAGDTEPLDLRNGSLIAADATRPAEPCAGTYLVVIGGPGSGRAALLGAGRPIVVGRPAGDDSAGIDDPAGIDLAVADGLLSNQHFRAELDTDGRVWISDLGSTNGTVVEGGLVEGGHAPVLLEPGQVAHAGTSLFTTITLGSGDHATLLGATATGLHIHRQFREAVADLPEPPAAPGSPRDHAGGFGSTWWRSLVPLATAVGMAYMTGRWWFLLIGALAPVVFAVDAWRHRRRQRGEQASEAQQYAVELAQHHTQLAEYRRAEVRRARMRAPGGGAGALLARFRHRRVWERRPADRDFGAVTLGFAARPSGLVTTEERRAGGPPELWQAPLAIDLGAEGPLGITGPPARAAAVARALLVDLVFTHAPTEVNLWVLTDEPRAADWEFAAWLPHAFGAGGGARVAATAPGRAALIQAVRGVIEARREQVADGASPTRWLPFHVVVIDGVDCLAAADLAEILRHGPEVGVIGIVADPSIVPEGVRGEVRLGRFDDESTYRSIVTPRVTDVTVAQLSAALATEAALALAPLEAFGPGSARGLAGGASEVYFTELVGFGDRSPEEQVAFWGEHSPRTDVPVGVALDGTPFTIDFVRHGPHGLIGGMTRSGKTEFLKTWFAALAMYNHPDDLAIAIVDFKGGVDHKITAGLPHVIALATNQNIDLFERTITLLTAELQRRERIFLDQAGVATIEGYRTARQRRPELPPMPRLLVVVDEFAELLDTPEGKAQVGRLESITRIGAGLGVHLVLLTQMFNNALPPTIDGQAGLRVCFKVQHGDHSKVVLKSPVAATISSSTKGRGIARFQGGDLVEFQAARIGNEARHRTAARRGAAGRLAVYDVTLDSLTRPPAPPEPREVPNEEQDLFHVVEVLCRASRRAGWRGGVVPWPAELPAALELADAPAGAIGLADDPGRQRVVPVRHTFTDAVVAYAGAPGTGHHTALSALAARLALDHSPDDLHMYGIDLLGDGLALLGGLPHAGAIATRDDATALRIIAYLSAEAARRRGVIARAGATDFESLASRGGDPAAPPEPRVVLFVLGLDRMFLHGEGVMSPLLAPMTTLVNEVPGTGIQVVFSGSHAALGNRVGTTAGRRLVFGANDPMEYPPSVPRPLRSQLGQPRRCFDTSSGLLAQLAGVAPEGVNVGDVFEALGHRLAPPAEIAARPPTRFRKAPWPLSLGDVAVADPVVGGRPGSALPLGVRPDSGEVVWLDPSEDGTAFRVIGPPKSGRSNALAAVGVLAKRCGWRVVVASASRRSPLLAMPELAAHCVPVDALPGMIDDGLTRPTVLLVDDAHRIDDEFPWKRVATGSGPLVTFVAGSTDALTRSLGIARALNAPGGVALACSRARDADGIGVRQIDDDWLVQPRAGVGIAAIAGEAHRIQFPLVVP